MSGAALTVIFHSDALVDRPALSACLPYATGKAMSAHLGGDVSHWSEAYRKIQADWDSYWADLNVNGEDSIAQWREGRWRIVAAHCRLMKVQIPSHDETPFYLDDLPVEIGRNCDAFHQTIPDVFKRLSSLSLRIVVTAPYLPASLIKGMSERARVKAWIAAIAGPERLEQVGLEGIDGRWLLHLLGGAEDRGIYVGPSSLPGIGHIAIPDDRTQLADAITGRLNHNDRA